MSNKSRRGNGKNVGEQHKGGKKGKASKNRPRKPATMPHDASKQVKASKYPRHPQNPYRAGSGYGLVFDILASHKAGMRRDELVKAYAEESGKEIRKGATWDCAVVLSPSESIGGPRHRSSREGYFVKREGTHMTLVLGPKEVKEANEPKAE